MKIRNGFVSNSSTSSFMIYGCEMPDFKDFYFALKYEVKKEIREYIVNDYNRWATEKMSNEGFETLLESDEYEDYDFSNSIYGYFDEKTILEVNSIPYCGTYIGRSYDSIKDDETGKEFKESVENFFKNILKEEEFKKYEFCEYKEAWND